MFLETATVQQSSYNYGINLFLFYYFERNEIKYVHNQQTAAALNGIPDSNGRNLNRGLDRLGLVTIKGLGITLEAGGVKNKSGHDIGVDVGGRAAVLEVALVIASSEAGDPNRRTYI